MAPRKSKPREAKPGELRGIHIMESMERLSKRPESRMDLQRVLEALSPDAQIYVRHLITSGPGDNKAAAKACNITEEKLELLMQELERSIDSIRFG